MKKLSTAAFSLVLAALICLTGCNETTAPTSVDSTSSSADDTTSTAPPTTPTAPVTLEDLPGPVTGTFQGQTITVEYLSLSDVDWPIDNIRPYQFTNGFATVVLNNQTGGIQYIDKYGQLLDLENEEGYGSAFPFDATGRALVQRLDGRWAYLDTNGVETILDKEPTSPTEASPTNEDFSSNVQFYSHWTGEVDLYGLRGADGKRITEPLYTDHGHFQDGLCFVRLAKGEHQSVLIDETGALQVVLPDGCTGVRMQPNGLIVCYFTDYTEYGSVPVRVCDSQGNLIEGKQFDKVYEFCDGLAPVSVDDKVGLIDENWDIVIPPTFPWESTYTDILVLNEGLISLNTYGKVGVLQVTRS